MRTTLLGFMRVAYLSPRVDESYLKCMTPQPDLCWQVRVRRALWRAVESAVFYVVFGDSRHTCRQNHLNELIQKDFSMAAAFSLPR